MNLSEENINQYLELQSYQRDNYQVNGVAGQSFYLLNGDFFSFMTQHWIVKLSDA